MRRIASRGCSPQACSLAPLLALSLAASALAQTAATEGSPALAAATEATGATTASPTPGQASVGAPAAIDADRERWRELRAGTSYYGPVGGVYIADAASGAAGSFRLHVATDFFSKRDYLQAGDTNRYLGRVLSLSATPIEHLELSAALATRSNRNDRYEPTVVHSVGNLHFDLKGYHEVTPGVTLGGDAMLSLPNRPGDVDVAFDATSVTLRGNVTLDVGELSRSDMPLRVRLNGAYTFDNSAHAVKDLEDERFQNRVASGQAQAAAREAEYKHYVDRRERLALGLNRVDRASVGIGFEVPIEVDDHFAIHPLAEWQIDVPVNRQAFVCPYVVSRAGAKSAGTDSCLDQEGVDTVPQHILVGARFWASAGLNVLAAVDIGIGNTTNFVQELAPQAPYRVVLGVGYTVDARPKPPQIREVEKIVEVAAVPPPMGRIQGSVVAQAAGTPVAGAKISFSGKDGTSLLGGADGRFASCLVEPGEIQLDVEAEGYEPGKCTTRIPPEGGDVTLTCGLVARPRLGSLKGQVLDSKGGPVPAVAVVLSGPETRTVTTDQDGRFTEKDLKGGEYSARVERDGFLISVTPLVIKAQEETAVAIQLTKAPKVAAVNVKKDNIQIRGAIFFITDTADIETRSEPLLHEIADAMLRNPTLLKVEVQGHTDDTGAADYNVDLSQRRAEAVRAWLVAAGVERDRLTAKGYGLEQPLAPNLTPAARAKNRRVEFKILERARE